MKTTKRWLSLILSLIMVLSVFTCIPITPSAATSLPNSIYITQATNYTCTLASATMMLRAKAYLSGCKNWSSITESAVKPVAWGNSLKWSFTYSNSETSISVSHANVSGISISSLKSLLNTHPEGIVLYCGNQPHAVLVTDYEGDTFYCSDPASGYSGDRRTLTNSYLSKKYSSQSSILSNTTAYWYVSNIGGTSHPTDAWIKSSRGVIPTGASNTFTFGATNAQSYTIGIDKNGERIITEVISSGKSYTFNEEGNYTAFVSCYGEGENFINSNKISFTVFSPVVMGDSFIANIANSEVKKNINATESGNVEMQSKNSSDSQKWLFELQSDGAYKITNVAYNKCMDVYCSLTEDGTNIQVYDSNSSYAQRFYLRLNESGYSIVPKTNTDSALDIIGCSYENGANIQQWKCSLGNVAQIFTIEYVDLYSDETRVFNGKTYKYYNISMPWTQAHKFCEKSGGHLATINSADENEFILDMVKQYKKDYCWLGATDYATENNWYWVKSEELTYNNWATSQPDNGNKEEHFMAMYTHNDLAGQWNDISNNSNYHKNKIGFICEYENDINENSYTPTKTFNYNGKEYEIYEDTVDWNTAKSICDAKGGHLVTFSDTEENEVVFNAIQSVNKDSYWIGYTDIVSEGEWRSVDAPHDTLSYKNWNVNEPGNGSNCEDYAFMRNSSSKWEDLKSFCYAYHNIGFICEYEDKEPKLLLGDADVDGKVNIRDATAIQKHIANLITLTEEGYAVADVDASGNVNVKDATAIQKHIAGIDTGFTIG